MGQYTAAVAAPSGLGLGERGGRRQDGTESRRSERRLAEGRGGEMARLESYYAERVERGSSTSPRVGPRVRGSDGPWRMAVQRGATGNAYTPRAETRPDAADEKKMETGSSADTVGVAVVHCLCERPPVGSYETQLGNQQLNRKQRIAVSTAHACCHRCPAHSHSDCTPTLSGSSKKPPCPARSSSSPVVEPPDHEPTTT